MTCTTEADTLALNSRQSVILKTGQLRAQAADLAKEAQELPPGAPERAGLMRGVQDRNAARAHLETVLSSGFIPSHGLNQLVSPRVFFVSPLFKVASKRQEREKQITLSLRTNDGGALFNYTGPELRQSDGLVFMGLLNQTKDARIGTTVSFSAEELCQKTFGRYDGPTRKLLRAHIQRLQRALLEFDTFSVQLCKRFEYPARGTWAVELDPDIVQLFRRSNEIWLDLKTRKELPEGLTTWLYGFIESQTRLIPTRASALRELCGSEASDESFLRTLRVALNELTDQGVIDRGWSVRAGTVHWMKRASA